MASQIDARYKITKSFKYAKRFFNEISLFRKVPFGLQRCILVSAFLEKRVDYSHGFLSVFFDTPEVTKIVLPKTLQIFKLYLMAQGTEPKKFFFFSA